MYISRSIKIVPADWRRPLLQLNNSDFFIFSTMLFLIVFFLWGCTPIEALLGKIKMQPEDRIGFVRFRKVGGTTLHMHLKNNMHLCVSQCNDECRYYYYYYHH